VLTAFAVPAGLTYGLSTGNVGYELPRVLVATLDLALARQHRSGMGFFRDRRPQLYGRLAEDR